MGDTIRTLRERRGWSIDHLTFQVSKLLPEFWLPSREYIRRLESGSITEEKADILVLARVAEALGIRLAKLSKLADQRMIELREQVNRSSAWVSGMAGTAA